MKNVKRNLEILNNYLISNVYIVNPGVSAPPEALGGEQNWAQKGTLDRNGLEDCVLPQGLA